MHVAYLTSAQICARFNIKVRTIWNWIEYAGFPVPVRFGIGPKAPRRWPLDAVEQWERARAARPDGEDVGRAERVT